MESELPDIEKEMDSSASYMNELNRIEKSTQSAEEKLNLLDILVKDFLRSKFHTKKSEEYSELIDIFLEKKMPHIAVLCHQMVTYLYSGDENDDASILALIEDIRGVLRKEFNVKPGLVSKQTEKTIEKYMKKDADIPLKDDESEEDNKAKKDNEIDEEVDYLKSKISMTQENQANIDSPRIQNIDDLERIKQKIRLRKIQVTRNQENKSP